MTKILIFKEALRKFYSRYSMYILPVIRFICALVSILIINHYVGYDGMINNPAIAIIISAVCSMLSFNVIVVLLSFLVIANIYNIAPEMALVAILMYIIMYIFYFRFSSKYGYLLILMPIFFFIKIPYIMPLIVGLALTPSAIVAMALGIVVFFMMKYAGLETASSVNIAKESGIDKASSFIKGIVSDKEMLVMILAFVIVALLVYFIKRMSIDYSSAISIIVGGIVELIIIVCAVFLLDIEGFAPIWLVCACVVISVGIMYILQFFIVAVDYSRTEYTQFEDDDYYYYVKAVPKINLTASDVRVKHINVKKSK
jgi:hypothetical protein